MNASSRKSLNPAAGVALAAGAAGLFLLPVTQVPAAEAKVQCDGSNACKGRSACSSAKNA
jgi:hypothetical protein